MEEEKATVASSATQETMQAHPKWRFPIGQRVEANTRGGEDPQWSVGTIVAHDYEEDGIDLVSPYQIRLDEGGTLIFAPYDRDTCVRALGSEGKKEGAGGCADGAPLLNPKSAWIQCADYNAADDPWYYNVETADMQYSPPREGVRSYASD